MRLLATSDFGSFGIMIPSSMPQKRMCHSLPCVFEHRLAEYYWHLSCLLDWFACWMLLVCFETFEKSMKSVNQPKLARFYYLGMLTICVISIFGSWSPLGISHCHYSIYLMISGDLASVHWDYHHCIQITPKNCTFNVTNMCELELLQRVVDTGARLGHSQNVELPLLRQNFHAS